MAIKNDLFIIIIVVVVTIVSYKILNDWTSKYFLLLFYRYRRWGFDKK